MSEVSEIPHHFHKAASLEEDFPDILSNTAHTDHFSHPIRESLDIFDLAIKKNPNDPVLYLHKGLALCSFKYFIQGIESYLQGLSLAPSHPELLLNTSQAYADIWDYQSALKYASLFLNVHKPKSEGYLHIANLHHEFGYYEEALQTFDQAIKQEPGVTKPLIGKMKAYLKLKKIPEALSKSKRVLEYDEKNLEARISRAQCQRYLKDFNEALKEIEQAIEMYPQSEQAHLQKGLILLSSGNNEEATKSLSKAIELSPKQYMFYCYRAMVDNKLGDIKQMQFDMNTAASYVEVREDYEQIAKAVTMKHHKLTLAKLKKDALSRLAIFVRILDSLVPKREGTTSKAKHAAVNDFKKNNKTETLVAKILELIVDSRQDRRDQIENLISEMLEYLNKLKLVAVELEEFKSTMKIGGEFDQVKAEQSFNNLDRENPRLSEYSQTFYWIMLSYLGVYRSFKACMKVHHFDSSKRLDYVMMGFKKYDLFGGSLKNCSKFLDRFIMEIDSFIETIYGDVKKKTIEDKIEFITDVVTDYGMNDNMFKVTMVKVSIDVARKRKAFILEEDEKKRHENLKLNWLVERIEAMGKMLIEDMQLFKNDVRRLALQDAVIVLAYLYRNHGRLEKGKDIGEFFVDAVNSSSFEEIQNDMGKGKYSYLAKKSICCSIF